MTAATAILTTFVPLVKLMPGDHSKREILWMGVAENACFIKIIFWQQICIKPRNQIKTIIINREKIYIVFIQIGQLPFQFFETWKSDGVAVLFSGESFSPTWH